MLRNVAFALVGVVAATAVAWGALKYARSPLFETTGPSAPVSSSQESPRMISAKIAESKSGKVAQATFGAGCFWGVESTFRAVPGVLSTWVGFAGGNTENPTYEDVCYSNTNHAEVVHLEYDPEQVTFEKLLSVFFDNHNPTTLNRQGPDVGSQYRSVVFYHDEAQRTAAEAAKRQVAEGGRWAGRSVVTQIAPFTKFYAAEDYHQQYNEKRGRTHCHN
jgi:peptide-methionine (S)-S-oxide reductase